MSAVPFEESYRALSNAIEWDPFDSDHYVRRWQLASGGGSPDVLNTQKADAILAVLLESGASIQEDKAPPPIPADFFKGLLASEAGNALTHLVHAVCHLQLGDSVAASKSARLACAPAVLTLVHLVLVMASPTVLTEELAAPAEVPADVLANVPAEPWMKSLLKPELVTHYKALALDRTAVLRLKAGDHMSAIRFFSEAIAAQKQAVVDAPVPQVQQRASRLCGTTRDAPEIIEHMPVVWRFHYHRAEVYEQRKQWAFALLDYEIAYATNPNPLLLAARSRCWRRIVQSRGGGGHPNSVALVDSMDMLPLQKALALLYDDLSPLRYLECWDSNSPLLTREFAFKPQLFRFTMMVLNGNLETLANSLTNLQGSESVEVFLCALRSLQDLGLALLCAIYWEVTPAVRLLLNLSVQLFDSICTAVSWCSAECSRTDDLHSIWPH